MTLYVYHVTPGHISQPCGFAILVLLVVANWKVVCWFAYEGIKITWLDLNVDIHKRTYLRQIFILRKRSIHVRCRSVIAEAQVRSRGSPREMCGGRSQWNRLFEYFDSPLSVSFRQYSMLLHQSFADGTSSLNNTL